MKKGTRKTELIRGEWQAGRHARTHAPFDAAGTRMVVRSNTPDSALRLLVWIGRGAVTRDDDDDAAVPPCPLVSPPPVPRP